MTLFLVDTNVLSEIRRPRPDRGVMQWFGATPLAALRLSVITQLELERGVLLARRRDPVAAASLERWLDSVTRELARPAIDVTGAIARVAAGIQVPDRRPLGDALIGATALHLGLTLVTRNEKDFEIPGLAVLNPFSG